MDIEAVKANLIIAMVAGEARFTPAVRRAIVSDLPDAIELIKKMECEIERLLKHAENARSAIMFKVEAERTAALGEGYDLIRTMGGRQPCSQCSGTGTRVYVMDSLERCKDCGGNGYTKIGERHGH